MRRNGRPETPHPSQTRRAVFALASVILAGQVADGVINPQFTPRDLIRGSEQVLLLEVTRADDGRLEADVKEVLSGPEGPETVKLRRHQSVPAASIARAFGDASTATAVLLLVKAGGPAGAGPDGMLLIGTEWFAVRRSEDGLVLEPDEQQMFSVWGGSARFLAEAARYVADDPRASFPVRSELTWREDRKVAALSKEPADAMLVEFPEPIGRGVLLLSEGGDRFFRAGPDGPEDVTEEVNLRSSSLRAVPVDQSGDGQMELLTWDGRELKLAACGEDGFGQPESVALLDECLSLDAVSVGDGRSGVVAATSDGPMLLTAVDNGFALELIGGSQEPPRNLGPGGICAVGDFTGDGLCDILRLHANGALLYESRAPGEFDAPLVVEVGLTAHPQAAVCGDFTHDGRLDVMVGGEGGLVLLARRSDGEWADLTSVTYELAHHGNMQAPRVSALSPADVNADGRQSVAVFYADRKPMAFFNRGFGCFGWARELDVEAAAHSLSGQSFESVGELEGLRAMRQGQSVGLLADLNDDAAPDLWAVAAGTDEAWVVFGNPDAGRRRGLKLTLGEPGNGPITVTVRDARRPSAPGGMYVVRPAMPVWVSRDRAGPVELQWTDSDGARRREQIVVVGRHEFVLD
ncbi:MAG: FG-GAP repeat domain-containing protein [Phycisphaerae bacterium]